MTTPTPEPTQENYQHGATYAADGVTQLTASSASGLVSTPPNTDPPLLVATNIYESRVPDGTEYPANEMALLFEAGEIVHTSKWNAAFPLAVVTTMTPATGAHGSTTPGITFTGQNFTPGTTVHFGANAATAVVITAPDLMTCTAPTATGASTVNVTVTNDGGTLTMANAFVYT